MFISVLDVRLDVLLYKIWGYVDELVKPMKEVLCYYGVSLTSSLRNISKRSCSAASVKISYDLKATE